MQSARWCFTINNPVQEDIDRLSALGDDVQGNGIEYIVYGREVGDNGTPHLQGFVIFVSRKRFATVRGVIGHRAHLEVARGTTAQAADYCKKDGDFTEFGIQPVGRERAPTITDFRDWVLVEYGNTSHTPSSRDIAIKFPNLFVRYGERLSILASHLCPQPTLTGEEELNDWQEILHQQLSDDPDDRMVSFYVDSDGGKGKSFFCRWYLTKYPSLTQILSCGKRDDIAHAIDVTKSIFLFNMPRGGMEYLQYTILEQLKDRMIFSPKYNSQTKILWKQCHVVVFCNEAPDETKMSADRFNIVIL